MKHLQVMQTLPVARHLGETASIPDETLWMRHCCSCSICFHSHLKPAISHDRHHRCPVPRGGSDALIRVSISYPSPNPWFRVVPVGRRPGRSSTGTISRQSALQPLRRSKNRLGWRRIVAATPASRVLFACRGRLVPAGAGPSRRSHWATAAPACAVGMVVLLDWVISSDSWSIPVLGILDEAGHLLTAAVILAALPIPSGSRLLVWALFGAVAIDVDHIPLYTFAPEFSVGGRPPTHSLLTALVLLAAAAVPAVRMPCLGLSIGVCLHFVRDLSTGPGIPIYWPVFDGAAGLPYKVYIVILGATAAIATRRVLGNRAGLGPLNP